MMHFETVHLFDRQRFVRLVSPQTRGFTALAHASSDCSPTDYEREAFYEGHGTNGYSGVPALAYSEFSEKLVFSANFT